MEFQVSANAAVLLPGTQTIYYPSVAIVFTYSTLTREVRYEQIRYHFYPSDVTRYSPDTMGQVITKHVYSGNELLNMLIVVSDTLS